MLEITHKDLIAQAEAQIETLTPAEAGLLLDDEQVQFVDIRDVRELQREGRIPGAVHAPRGMLEFWIDPSSPYFKEVFGSGKRFVFYCQSGWRSALSTKTLQDMGLRPICHIGGGYAAWKAANLPQEALPLRK